MKVEIDNFTGAQKVRQALEDIEKFDVFKLYMEGYITVFEKEKIGGILEKVQYRLIDGLKEFESKQLKK